MGGRKQNFNSIYYQPTLILTLPSPFFIFYFIFIPSTFLSLSRSLSHPISFVGFLIFVSRTNSVFPSPAASRFLSPARTPHLPRSRSHPPVTAQVSQPRLKICDRRAEISRILSGFGSARDGVEI